MQQEAAKKAADAKAETERVSKEASAKAEVRTAMPGLRCWPVTDNEVAS